MTIGKWLSLTVEIWGIGAAFFLLFLVGSWVSVKVQRAWYRWRVKRDWSRIDRLSLEALARLERKP